MKSPSSMTGGYLNLAPKSVSPLGSSKTNPAIAAFLDPKPDWSLDDLKTELETLVSKFHGGDLPHDQPTPPRANVVSWRDLSVVANFGRKKGSFVMRAFDTDNDESSDDESDENAGRSRAQEQNLTQPKETSVPRVESGHDEILLLPRTEVIQASLLELERERILRVQVEVRQRQLVLEKLLEEEQQRAAAIFSLLEKDELARCELARRSDKQDQRSIAEARDMHLSALQRDHEQQSQVEERRIRKEAAAEEAHRKEIAAQEEKEKQIRARNVAEAKQKAELEREKAAADAAERKAHSEAAAAAALHRLETERKVKQEAEEKLKGQARLAVVTTVPKPKVSEKAAKLEDMRMKRLLELQDACMPLVTNPALKKDLKVYDKQIVKHLQQVSATQQQVRKKTQELIQFLCDPRGPPQEYLVITLASKLLSQCESQVLKLPRSAFPLAQVIVNVGVQVPSLMEAVLGKLNEVCIFTVPKYFSFSKSQFSSDNEYYSALRYRDEGGKLESSDDYIARMSAYVTFYAAITQSDAQGGHNSHGLYEGWAWCARLLNSIPANRFSACVLEAFLKIAGYRLYQAYPKPFMKLMQVVVSEFIVSLVARNEDHVRPVVNRLETYLHTRQFLVEPQGRTLSEQDISSQLRA